MNGAGLHWLRRITYMPALLLADTIVMFSPLVRRETRRRCGDRLGRAKVRAGAAAAEYRGAPPESSTPNSGSVLPPPAKAAVW